MSLIVVDIQPEYKSYIPFLRDWVNYINKTKQEITFLYNGQDTLGMVSKYDYQDWLVDIGVTRRVVENATFYDKGYAFFRYCMDRGDDHDEIVGLVKFMHESGVNDTRDLDDAFWDEYIAQNGSENLREALQHSEDCINIPDLMDFLKPYNNITLCGGGVNECLKEVEIALDALGKRYKKLTQYTYRKGGRTLKNGGNTEDYPEDYYDNLLRHDEWVAGTHFYDENKYPSNKRYIFSHEDTVTFRNAQQTETFKPRGLWYSLGMDWLRWVSSEMAQLARVYEHLHEIKVTNKVLKLNTISEAIEFTKKYGDFKGEIHTYIKWEEVAKDYSGIEVKDPARWSRMREHDLFWLYSWDVASGCVWKADGIESITLLESKPKLRVGGKLTEARKAEIRALPWLEMEVMREPRGDNGLEGYDRGSRIYYYKAYESENGRLKYIVTNGYNTETGKVFGDIDEISSIVFGRYFRKIEFKSGGNLDGKTYLQFSSHRARDKFKRMNIPHEKFVSTKSWNHYTVVATNEVDKILEYVKKGVKVVKAKINEDDLVRPWKKNGGIVDLKVPNYKPFEYTIGGL